MNNTVQVEETEQKFIVSIKSGCQEVCLHTTDPDGALIRLKETARKSSSLVNLAKNPKAVLDLSIGIALKAFWETIFCPAHGIVGQIVAGAVIVGAGLLSRDHWAEISRVLEWLVPVGFVARAGWQVHKVNKAAKAIAEIPDSKIQVLRKIDHSDDCVDLHHHETFSWRTAFRKNNSVVLHKPKIRCKMHDVLP